MEVRHAFRNGKAFADADQWASFKSDDSTFLIIGCDAFYFTDDDDDDTTLQPGSPAETEEEETPLHAVYVKRYDAKSQIFYCINSWGPGKERNPYPEIYDADRRITQFHAFRVHLVDESEDMGIAASAQPSASAVQSPPGGLHLTISIQFRAR